MLRVAWISVLLWTVWGIFPARAGELEWFRWKGVEGIQFGGSIDEMHAVRVIPSKDGQGGRMVYGDRLGLIHVLRSEKGRFREEWVSTPIRGAVAEIFVDDVDADGELDMVAYSELGDIVFYRLDNYKMVWRSTDDQYATISAMVVANVDQDPQLEMVFTSEAVSDVAGYRPTGGGNAEDREREREDQVSRLVVYDCRNLFVEWNSEPGLSARSIAVGDLDGDGNIEIALNRGFILDAAYQHVEWRHHDGFGDKIGYADVDGDGIPELIGEFQNAVRPRRLIRIYDVDLRTESFLSTGR